MNEKDEHDDLPLVEAFKSRIRAHRATGANERHAIYLAITEDIPAYIAALRECNFTNDQIVDCINTYGVPEDDDRFDV